MRQNRPQSGKRPQQSRKTASTESATPGRGKAPSHNPMARAAAILKRLAVLLLLLALPAVALSSPLPKTYWPALCIWAALLSLLAFFVVRSDKHKASAGQWRTPESTLHMLELLGGWPGSFLAQRQYRHKVSKTSYQIVFWLIVLLYQLAALDSIQGWPWAHALLAQSGLVTR